MAGRHRKAPAWRKILASLVRSRDSARVAALGAEVVALRATVVELRADLELARARAEAATIGADQRWLSMRLPLVQVALADPIAALASPDRSPDVPVEVVEAAPAAVAEAAPAAVAEDAPSTRMARMAWSVLANLPERDLLDPRTDRLNRLDVAGDAGEAAAVADSEATAPVSASHVNVA